MTPTIVFAPLALDAIRQAVGSRGPGTHDEATGGILIGKRTGDRVLIVDATEPGPNANDRRMGFALDVDHANVALQGWFDRDPDVDIVGVWHAHPPGPVALTPEDVTATYTLRDDIGREVVSLIAVASEEEARVTCFYLDAAAIHPAAPVVAALTAVEEGAPVAVPEVAPSTVAERSAPPPRSAPSAGRALALGLGVLVLLLLAAGLLRGFTSGGSGSVPGTTAEATPSVIAAVEPSITAAITMTAPPAPAPTNTAAPSPTTPATASPTPLRATPTVAAAVTPEEGPPLPYILRLEPMTAAARTAFLARARAANCADCFNVDLIGPEPYVELRVKIDDDDPPVLRTFEVPSLAFVAPADEPRTLQAFDLQDNPVSPPISVDVAPDRYYVLRIVTP